MAKYLLNTAAFMPRQPGGMDELLPEGTEVITDDDLVPGPHMDPLDGAAKAAVERRGPARRAIPEDIKITEDNGQDKEAPTGTTKPLSSLSGKNKG